MPDDFDLLCSLDPRPYGVVRRQEKLRLRGEVVFKSHAPTFVAERQFEYQGQPDCCGGFYPKDASTVQVPPLR